MTTRRQQDRALYLIGFAIVVAVLVWLFSGDAQPSKPLATSRAQAIEELADQIRATTAAVAEFNKALKALNERIKEREFRQ